MYLGGAQNPEIALKSESELIKITDEDLKILLGANGKIAFAYTALNNKAIPQYNVGYGRFLKVFEDVEKSMPGLYFAGNYRNGVSLSDSIHSGLSYSRKISAVFRTNRE
jgi:oxygen-dependent protoporphyrinogen oxidase